MNLMSMAGCDTGVLATEFFETSSISEIWLSGLEVSPEWRIEL